MLIIHVFIGLQTPPHGPCLYGNEVDAMNLYILHKHFGLKVICVGCSDRKESFSIEKKML